MTRLAISSIAWNNDEEVAVAEKMAEHGIDGVELAPSQLFPRGPLAVTDAEVAAVRRRWEVRGISIVALQALLFGHPELTLFVDADTRRRTFDYLAAVVRLGGQLGAGALVFGSPKNRARGELPLATAERIAVDFFGELARVASEAGTCLCIEPNPRQYGADFITTAAEAVALVAAVDAPGFKLHLDTACARLAGDDLLARIEESSSLLRHVHISEPELAPVGPEGLTDLRALAQALARVDYRGYVSIEMRRAPDGVAAVARALAHARSCLTL